MIQEMDSVLVTGSNRGLGLELVQQLVSMPNPPSSLFATCRYPANATALKEIQTNITKTKLHILKMDTTKSEEIEETVKAVEILLNKKGLNLLINNAGTYSGESFPNISLNTIVSAFNVNTIGHVMVTQAFYPLLKKAADAKASGSLSWSRAAVFNISSSKASLELCEDMMREKKPAPTYAASKAALIMMMRMISFCAGNEGILVVSLSPGWNKTEMGTDVGGIKATLDPKDTIAKLISLGSRLNETHTGLNIDVHSEDVIP